MRATVQKIRGVLRDEWLVNGRAGLGGVAGSAGRDFSVYDMIYTFTSLPLPFTFTFI
jgi:hypothetical protein